jgi:hypothetical protein
MSSWLESRRSNASRADKRQTPMALLGELV